MKLVELLAKRLPLLHILTVTGDVPHHYWWCDSLLLHMRSLFKFQVDDA